MTDDQRKEAKRRAKNAERMRKWREKNPPTAERKNREAARVKKWRDANPEKYREQQKKWRARFRDKESD